MIVADTLLSPREMVPVLIAFAAAAAGAAAAWVMRRQALAELRDREQRRAEAEERLRELGEDRATVEARFQRLRAEQDAARAFSESLEQLLSEALAEDDNRQTRDRIAENKRRMEDLELELARTRTYISSMPELPTSASELAQLSRERAERRQLEEKLADYERVVPFEDESQRAKRSSTVAFVSGVLIVLVVLGVAIRDWLEHDDGDALTTGTGLARLGAVLAAFYVAGQLFKRSTALQIRSQEFERAAIAMKVTPDLAEQIVDRDARDEFVIQIYASHLTSPSPEGNSGKGETGRLDVAAIIDGYNKLRSGGG